MRMTGQGAVATAALPICLKAKLLILHWSSGKHISTNVCELLLQAVLLVETDQDNYLASSTGKQAFWSAFTTFNLTVMGNSVLPMPYAFSKTGAIIGFATMLLVALCNDFTTLLMISAVYETGHDSYESLALWAGGKVWKVSWRCSGDPIQQVFTL